MMYEKMFFELREIVWLVAAIGALLIVVGSVCVAATLALENVPAIINV